MNVAFRRFSDSLSSPSLRFFSSSGSSSGSSLASSSSSFLSIRAANRTGIRTKPRSLFPVRISEADATKTMQRTNSSGSGNASDNRQRIPDLEDFHALHEEALSRAEGTYIDPSTGFMVFTELTHLKRGRCCGNRCRHCPYGFERVPQLGGAAASSWRSRRRRRAPEDSNASSTASNTTTTTTPTTTTTTTTAAATPPVPGAPNAKLRSGDTEKAQQMVREILERAGKWNLEDNNNNGLGKASNRPVRGKQTRTGTAETASDSEDSSSVSESSHSSSDSDSDSSTSTTDQKTRRTVSVKAPSTITVIEASTASTATVSETSKSTDAGSECSSSSSSSSNASAGFVRATLRTTKNVPYTRSGDTGTSQLGTGERRSKTDDAFAAMGTVDELCSFVGVAHSHLTSANADRYGDLPERLLDVMSRLFDVGSHIAKPPPIRAGNSGNSDDDESPPVFVPNGLGDGFASHHVDDLEDWIHEWTEDLPELTSFVLPTGSPAAASLQVARTVCRRAERTVVPLARAGVCDPNALRYLNRLSDALFVAARWVNLRDGREEIEYRLPASVSCATRDQRERVHRSLASP